MAKGKTGTCQINFGANLEAAFRDNLQQALHNWFSLSSN